MVGRKTTDEVGCLDTLMNSLNEVISVHYMLITHSVSFDITFGVCQNTTTMWDPDIYRWYMFAWRQN